MLARFLKWLVLVGVVLFLLLWTTAVVVGTHLTIRPRRAAFENPETLGGYAVEDVVITAGDGILISAWYAKAGSNRAVIYASGIDADRRQCRSRAELFLDMGYSILLPDLRATGRSGGDQVTVGWEERLDLIACYRYLRETGYAHIGLNGISLGAAAICYAVPDLPDAAFIVVESSYDTFRNAVRNRLAFAYMPHFIAYPYYAAFWGVTGAPPWKMRPMDFLERCRVPALILAGDSERELKVGETMALYEHCAAPLKQVHLFAGGRHENFLGRYPEEYREVLTRFLQEAEMPTVSDEGSVPVDGDQ